MDICVCIGSACHKNNSYNIMKELKRLVDENGIGNTINIVSAFCLGHCKEGVTMKIGDQLITGVSEENIEDIFYQYVLYK